MNGSQNFVGAAGAALIALNYWTGGARPTVSAGLFNSSATTADTQAAHKQLAIIGGEAIFVVVAVVLAGMSNTWATVLTVAMVGLFILWAMNHHWAKSAQTTSQTGPLGLVKGVAA